MKKTPGSSIDLDYLKRWKARPAEWKFEWLVAAKEFNEEIAKNRPATVVRKNISKKKAIRT